MKTVELRFETAGAETDYFMREAFNTLRTNVLFCGTSVKTIAVTSCFAHEGKTTVSLEMAKSLAEAEKRVLFIDADLRKSVTVSRYTDQKGIEGLSQLMQTIRTVKKAYHPALKLEGILLTMFDGRTNLSQQVVQEVKRHFGAQVFPVVIPRSVRLSEAPSYGQPINVYDRASKGAKAYEKLANCLIEG